MFRCNWIFCKINITCFYFAFSQLKFYSVIRNDSSGVSSDLVMFEASIMCSFPLYFVNSHHKSCLFDFVSWGKKKKFRQINLGACSTFTTFTAHTSYSFQSVSFTFSETGLRLVAPATYLGAFYLRCFHSLCTALLCLLSGERLFVRLAHIISHIIGTHNVFYPPQRDKGKLFHPKNS